MKKALLVGINKYKLPGNDLTWCVNDVLNVRDILLTYYGFSIPDIRVLTDERATRQEIIHRLHWLTVDAKAGDNLVFHFSGHGSQIRDRNGDELKDHLDELICPFDMSWNGTYVIDDDLAAIFGLLQQGVILDVILDSCHSGNATRNGFIEPGISFTKQRYMPLPVDIACRNEEGVPKRGLFSWLIGLFSGEEEENNRPITTMNHALFAACQDKQYSVDAKNAFTSSFCDAIRKANGQIKRNDLKNAVKDSLHRNGFDQIPQLEAPKNMFYGEVFR